MALSPRFTEALVLAARLHGSQLRKGPTRISYVGHLLSVAGIVIEYGGTEDEAIAALLHDAVEDQGGPSTRETIRRLFGETVAAIVDACTDTDQVPKPPWKERKENYIDHLRKASPSVLLVAAADKLANVRSLLKDYREAGEGVWDRFTASREESLWYYRSVVAAIQPATPQVTALLGELSRAVSELEELTIRNASG